MGSCYTPGVVTAMEATETEFLVGTAIAMNAYRFTQLFRRSILTGCVVILLVAVAPAQL